MMTNVRPYWTLHLSFAAFRPCSAMAFISWAFAEIYKCKKLVQFSNVKKCLGKTINKGRIHLPLKQDIKGTLTTTLPLNSFSSDFNETWWNWSTHGKLQLHQVSTKSFRLILFYIIYPRKKQPVLDRLLFRLIFFALFL